MKEENAARRSVPRRFGPTGTVIPPTPPPRSSPPITPTQSVAAVSSVVPRRSAVERPTPPSSARPLLDAMHAVSLDLLTLAGQLGLGALPTSSRVLRDHIGTLLGEMRERALAAGVPAEDIEAAQFAIVALLDELLCQANWPGRGEWQTNPLQYSYFRDNAAGETFFRYSHALLAQPHRAHVLLIYYYCLALGFQGRHAVNGGAELSYLYRGMANGLETHLLPAEPLSPHGVPADADRSVLHREAPLVRGSLALVGIALALFLVLRVAMSFTVTGALHRMHAPAVGAQGGT